MKKRYKKILYEAGDYFVYTIDNFIDHLHRYIYKILETLTIVFESELLDEIRYKFGTWDNLRKLRSNLEFDYRMKTKRKVVRVEGMVMQDSFITAEIYHEGLNEKYLYRYLRNATCETVAYDHEKMVIKKLDDHHTRIIYEY